MSPSQFSWLLLLGLRVGVGGILYDLHEMLEKSHAWSRRERWTFQLPFNYLFARTPIWRGSDTFGTPLNQISSSAISSHYKPPGFALYLMLNFTRRLIYPQQPGCRSARHPQAISTLPSWDKIKPRCLSTQNLLACKTGPSLSGLWTRQRFLVWPWRAVN